MARPLTNFVLFFLSVGQDDCDFPETWERTWDESMTTTATFSDSVPGVFTETTNGVAGMFNKQLLYPNNHTCLSIQEHSRFIRVNGYSWCSTSLLATFSDQNKDLLKIIFYSRIMFVNVSAMADVSKFSVCKRICKN